VVLVVAGLFAYVLWPRSPTPISEQEALEGFRSATTVAGAPSAGPAPGVYSYDADGTEDVSYGPIPLPTRDIPATVTGVVEPDGAGCYRFGLNLMAEHTETTTWCVGADGSLVLQRQDKQEQVPGFDVKGTTTCSAGVVLDPASTSRDVACRLVMEVAGITLDVDLAGTATVEPGGDVTVGDARVPTRHLVIAMAASGDMSGHWTEEHWLTDDLTDVRTVRDVLLDGPGRFEEHTTLELRSLQPRT
jgi:hypothetical protein